MIRHTRIRNRYQRNTTPDLTFVSENLMLDYAWEIMQDTLGSDHLPIILTIQNNNLQGNQNTEYHRLHMSQINTTA